jgi:hypothetical protein
MTFAFGSHLRGCLRWLGLLLRHGRPSRVFHFNGGSGDQLLCGCVAHELARRGEKRLWFLTQNPELLAGLPGVSAAVPFDIWLVPWFRLGGTPVETIRYAALAPDRDIPPGEPIIAALCRSARIAGRVALRPHLPMVPANPPPPRARPRVAVQSSCLAARYPIPNKQWPVDRMRAVVTELGGEIDFVQLGSPADPLLPGVEDLRGKTDLFGAAGILAGCDLFLGLVGFLMHLARAVECPAVIVYGGREPPEISGYACNTNLASRPPCAPCWNYVLCDYERTCLTAITVDEVIAAVRRRLSAPLPRPLPMNYADILPDGLAVATA